MKKDIKNLTTLCYIEQNDSYLMLHRVSKENDINHGKWIGVGGHFKEGESPEECLLREVKEETGLELTSYRMRGIITFVYNETECEYMHLYTADAFNGSLDTEKMSVCEEGILKWVPKTELENLNLWEGDKIFLKMLLEEEEMFSLKLEYHGEELIKSEKNIWNR